MIFVVPDPAKGVGEMARVVRPGGAVAAYASDLAGGGFPFEPIHAELRAAGATPSAPPSPDASREATLRDLWTGAGLEAVDTREITVHRTFADFEDFWHSSSSTTGTMRATFAAMAASELDLFKARLRARLPADAQGRISYTARANAIKGRVPKAA